MSNPSTGPIKVGQIVSESDRERALAPGLNELNEVEPITVAPKFKTMSGKLRDLMNTDEDKFYTLLDQIDRGSLESILIATLGQVDTLLTTDDTDTTRRNVRVYIGKAIDEKRRELRAKAKGETHTAAREALGNQLIGLGVAHGIVAESSHREAAEGSATSR